MAQDRQGSGAPGFAAPSFNIPFQPNFQFNEIGNFLDGNGGFAFWNFGGDGADDQEKADERSQVEKVPSMITGVAEATGPLRDRLCSPGSRASKIF